MSTQLSIGASATVQYFPASTNYVASGSGDLAGAIWARATSQPRDLGDGRAEFTMVREFLRPDGSSLSTTDVAVLTPIDGDEVRLTVQHTVVDSSGRLAGLRGTFSSVGVHDLKTGQGVQRFYGAIG